MALTAAFAESPDVASYGQAYAQVLTQQLAGLDHAAVKRLAAAIEHARQTGGTVFIAGNGGSAACAAHYVNDLAANTVVPDTPGYRVISLADNAASITALGNDCAFDEVFSRQLAAAGRQGDLLIVLSVSGNSPNICRALEQAARLEMHSFACCGMDGGRAATLSNDYLLIPSARDAYGPVEDCFGVVMHIVCGYLAQARGRALAHD